MGRTRIETALAELKKRIECCENNKKKLLGYIHQLKDKCLKREITYSEYEKLLNKKQDGRTLQEWLDYYDSYIKDCKERIKNLERKNKTKKIKIVFLFLAAIIILAVLVYYFRPVIVGLITQTPEQPTEPTEESYSETQEEAPPSEQSESAIPSPSQEEEPLPSEQSEEPTLPSEQSEEPTLPSGTEPTLPSEQSEKPASTSETEEIIEIPTSELVEENITFPEIPQAPENITLPKENITTPESSLLEKETSERKGENITLPESPETPENITEIKQAPVLIKKIPDLKIEKNKFLDLKISDYFSNAENYFLLQVSSLTTTTYDHVIRISPEKDFLGARTSKIIATNPVGVAESNFFNIIVSEAGTTEANITIPINITIEKIIEANATISTLQYNAVIGKNVRWKKQIQLEKQGIIKIKLPKQAENITVNKLIETSQESYSETQEAPPSERSEESAVSSPSQEQGEPLPSERSEEPTFPSETEPSSASEQSELTSTSEELRKLESISKKIEELTKQVEELKETAKQKATENMQEEQTTQEAETIKQEAKASITGGITGRAIEDGTGKSIWQYIFDFFRKIFSAITGRAITTEEKAEEIEITIDDNALRYEIEYETPAPQSFEKEISARKKQIIISAPDELNYTNILAFTQLPTEAPAEKIKLYHLVNETINRTEITSREEVNITKYDLNNNSLIDYIEWVVPHLSNQTYELIIEISKAEHLNENKEFISDIYEQVKALDGNWSEPIPAEHYVRVTFKKNLTKDNDITIYARASNHSNNSEECYDNETQIITRVEVDCDEVNCEDENVYCEYYDENGNLINDDINKINENDGINSLTATDALSFEDSNTYNKYNYNNRILNEDLVNNENSNLDNSIENINSEVENAINVASMVMQIFADYNDSNDDTYINLYKNKEKNGSKDVTLKVLDSPQDYSNYNDNIYLNVSVHNKNVEEAAVTRMVLELPHEQYLLPPGRSPISILGRSASTLENSKTSKKCYREEWKLFKDLNDGEKVMTLNSKTGEKEWQLPLEKQEFDYNREMYEVILEDENGKESELVVSEEHKVYARERDYNFLSNIMLNKSSVVYTLTNDCSLRCGSLDQIKALIDNANAKYGESLGSGRFIIAFINMPSYSDSLKNLIDSSTSACLIPNSCSESLDLNRHSSSYFINSDLINSGAKNSALINENKYAATDSGFIIENKTLLSNTSFILSYLYSSLFSGDIDFNNSSLLLGESLESNLLNESFFALLPSSTDHLINSCSSFEFNCSFIFLSNSCLLDNSCLTSADKFNHKNFFIALFNSSSIANVTDAIYISPLAFNSSSFSSSLIFSDITLLANSATFTSGNSFLKLANNSSGMCTVILNDFAILTPCSIYVNTSNYANVYKPFGKKDLSKFKLQPITETYHDFNEGKELYFLDSENKPIKVKSITKQAYNGKIYDVDVKNDIVLVRRKNSSEIWSGNSNQQQAQIEVYRKDDNTLIAKFENITTENWHKIYLTNLSENESYETFDLKVVGVTGIELDYIVDPTLVQVQYYLIGGSVTGAGGIGNLQTTVGNARAIWETNADGQSYTWTKQYTEATTLDIQTFVIGFWCNATATAGGDNVEVEEFYVYDCGSSSNCTTQDAVICSNNLGAQAIDCDFTTAATFNTISCTSGASRTLDTNDYLGVMLVADIADGKTPDLRLHFNNSVFNTHFNVTETILDLIYPTFNNYWDNNASLVGSGIGKFNVTLLNTNGTVLLEINNTNITATNLTASVYNVSYNFTDDGTYTYRWHSWGNGTDKNYNKSIDRSYTVNISYGTLSVNLTTPLDGASLTQNENFYLNATVTCSGGTNAKCGTIYALARYNATTATPDTAINTTTIFVNVTGRNPNFTSLSQGEQWNVSWQIKPTQLGFYELGVLFNSSYGSASVPENHTNNVTVKIVGPPAVTGVNATPQKVLNSSTVIINATITSTGTIDTVRAILNYPNGTWWQNLTMSNTSSSYNATVTASFTPAGTYNITIWANDTLGSVNSSEKTWFAPFFLFYNFSEITIDGGFTDWAGARNVTDIIGDNVSGTNNYNFSSTINKNAYKYNATSLPSSPPVHNEEASSNEYTALSARDDNYFNTTNATNEGEMDMQIFIFNISEIINPITSLNLEWEGYGEILGGGYNTNLSIFNWSSQKWVKLSNTTYTSAVDKNLTGEITSSINDFINSTTKQVAILVSTRNGPWTCGVHTIEYGGRAYNTVLIGSQCWLREHLNVGTMIAGGNEQGSNCPSLADIEKYCSGDSEGVCTTDGGLYQWNQAMCGSTTEEAQGICPTGWHIPSNAEWYTLESGLWNGTGSCTDTRTTWGCVPAGSNLSEYTLNGNNDTGFSAILAGWYSNVSFNFGGRGSNDNFWTSSQSTSTTAFRRQLSSTQAGVYRDNFDKGSGFSVRCLKNSASPFFYTYEGEGYKKVSDFIGGAIAPEKEYTSFDDITNKIDIVNRKVKLKITEEFDETTYLDRIYLRVDNSKIIELSSISKNENGFFRKLNNNLNSKALLRKSDNNYLVINQGEEYYLEFEIRDYEKLEFVAEGYYIKHYGDSVKKPHRSLYTDFIQLRVSFSGGDDFDFSTISLSNNETNLFALINIDGNVDLSSTTRNYRVYISENESSGNSTSPEGTSLPVNYNYLLESFNRTLWKIYNSSYINIKNITSVSNNSDSIEISVLLTDINVTTGENINVSFETAGSSSYDFAPDSRSFLSFNITSGVSPPTDTIYPIFSNYWDNNATLVDFGTGLFNVTVLNTNGTVLLEIDGQNITARNLSANVYNASYVLVNDGTYTYRWHSWGNGTNKNYNNSGDRYYTVNATPPDNIYPNFSGYWDNNASLTGSGTGLFNVTLLNTNGTVILEINNTNITATNLTANVYNASYNFTLNGTYTYRWHSWGNGTNKNYNKSIDRYYTVNASSQPPQITRVYNESMTDVSGGLNSGPFSTSIIINFTAYDADGASDLNDSSARINFTKTGENTRENLTCAKTSSGGNYANYTCNVTMWWWDAAGTWNIAAYIEDNNSNSAQNTSAVFQVGPTIGFEISPAILEWAGIAPGSVNQTSNNDPLILNNTGNVAINANNIQINATNLRGETDNTKALWAGNFSIGTTTGGTPPAECGATVMNASQYMNITGASLPKGNYTKNDGTAQEQLYVCLKIAGSELITQPYSTSQEGSWIIQILLAALIVKRIRRKKKKQKAKIKNLSIPSTIFSKKLGFLEGLTKYLKENLKFTYHEIAEILNRDERTIWTAYKKSREKQPEAIEVKKTFVFLPVTVLKNRNLTILESIIMYLKEQGLRYIEIAKLLNRDQRNIWLIYSRAVKKTERKI